MNSSIGSSVKTLIIRIISVIFFMEIFDAGVLNTSLPQIAKSLHHNPIDLKAAITTYILSLGIFIPVSGWCADRIGEKKTLYIAIMTFTLGSIGCAFSMNLTMLVCFRLLQGVGGGFLMPVARLVLIRVFGNTNTAEAMSKVGMINIMAMLSAPLVGGMITTYLHWRFIFLINVPIGLWALYYIHRYLPILGELQRTPFDFRGFILIGAGLGSLLFLLDIIVYPYVTLAMKISLLFFCIACFGVYRWHEKRETFPLIQSAIFNPFFRVVSWGSFLSRLTLSAQAFLVPLLLQSVYNFSAAQAGFMIIPMALGAFVARFYVGRLINLWGAKNTVIINTLITTILFASFVVQAFVLMPVVLLMQQFLYGISFVIQIAASNALAYRYMYEPYVSNASSFYSAVIQLSASFGIALAALTMVSVSGHADLTHSIPTIAFKVVFITQAIYGVFAIFAFLRIKT